MPSKKHDDVAKQIAQKFKTKYNPGPGADVKGPKAAAEIEMPGTIGEAGRQLQGYKKPVYVVPAVPKAVPAAVKRYKNTTIGVMDPSGKVVKPSTRCRKKK